MLYPTFPVPPQIPALPDGVVGHFAGPGGLNNQKLALLGVLREAVESRRPIVLPYFTVIGRPPSGGRLIRLFDLYEQEPLLSLAQTCGIQVLRFEPPGGPDGGDHFNSGSQYLHARLSASGPAPPNDFGFAFLRALVPRLRSSPFLAELADQVFRRHRVRVAVQLRVESDWVVYARDRLDVLDNRTADNAPSAATILGKLQATLPEISRTVYVTVNEDDMPAHKETIRAEVRRLFGIDLIWKSDLIAPSDLHQLNRTDLAALDFEMALRAEHFVGTSHSTFANLVTTESYAMRGRPVRGHFLWNVASPTLHERTDEGLAVSPLEATDPNRPRYVPDGSGAASPAASEQAPLPPSPGRTETAVSRSGGSGISLWGTFLGKRGRPTDKWNHYFPAYETHLRRYVNRPVVLIEIGVGEGGSLEMWRSYLGPFAQIVGIDNTPMAAQTAGPHAAVRIGHQADPELLASVIEEFGTPDIVIDDGGHHASDMVASFRTLYPRLAPDGVYIVEDLHAAYWEEYGGGLRREGTFIELCKNLIDELNAEWIREGFSSTEFTSMTQSMHFYDSMVVFQRGRHAQAGVRLRGG